MNDIKRLIFLSSLILLSFASSGQDTVHTQTVVLSWSPDPTPSQKLHQLFEEVDSVERTHVIGVKRSRSHPERIIAPPTIEAYTARQAMYEELSRRLTVLYTEELSGDDIISAETMALKLNGQITQLKYQMYLIPFNAEGGWHTRMSSIIQRLPYKTVDDYKAYAKWLPSVVNYIDGYSALMQQGIETGIVAPKIIVENMMTQLEPWLERAGNKHPMTAMLSSKPQDIDEEAWSNIKSEIINIMTEDIWPAYDKVMKFIKEDYYPMAYEKPGISNIPNGRGYYEERSNYFTTLDMTPDEIYDRGVAEVARIREQMEAIIEEVEYDGSFSDFLEYLRTDEQFYAKSPQELLSYAAWLSKKAEGQLPRLFSDLYKVPFTVEPVPDDIAPTYKGGRYVQGSRHQDRPGIYWVNTYNLPARSLYNIPALTVHEAVPGHHLQIMLAAELEGLPAFRNNFYISAFGEGWGLYSEYLGEEMGMYETPYDRFGRYTYEMWRACRLVVDVGLHYKDWSRQKAVDFLANNTALSIHEVNTEIDRYIGWPGQALSYKIGELTIKDLRSKAEVALGDDFDIKEFHYRVLKNGSVPLPTLIREIEGWIEVVDE